MLKYDTSHINEFTNLNSTGRLAVMKLIVKETYMDCCKEAASLFIELINKKPDALLGLATGDTPKGLYKMLIEAYGAGEADFSRVRTVNLDEYAGLPASHDQSYMYFMQEHLFKHINIDQNNITIANGTADTAEEEYRMRRFFDNNRVDLQLLGVGRNGHIGFNEPDTKLHASFHYTALTDDTIDANSRMFANADDVPRGALTMGMGEIMQAYKIIMLANGVSKADAVSGLITTDCIDPMNPCTMLKLHPDVTVIIDRELADAIGAA